MAVSHELYEDLDSLTRSQELYLKAKNGLKPMTFWLENISKIAIHKYSTNGGKEKL